MILRRRRSLGNSLHRQLQLKWDFACASRRDVVPTRFPALTYISLVRGTGALFSDSTSQSCARGEDGIRDEKRTYPTDKRGGKDGAHINSIIHNNPYNSTLCCDIFQIHAVPDNCCHGARKSYLFWNLLLHHLSPEPVLDLRGERAPSRDLWSKTTMSL